MKLENLRTVAQYAREQGTTPKTIYLRIKSGKLKWVQIGEIKLIITK